MLDARINRAAAQSQQVLAVWLSGHEARIVSVARCDDVEVPVR